jgi:hypothetical protein
MSTRKYFKDGSAVIEDDAIRVRVTCRPDGSDQSESMGARPESMLVHTDRILAMIAEAKEMLHP